MIHHPKRVYLDLETTGLDPRTEDILEIGLLADDGTVLIDSLVKPQRRTSWPEAQSLHGISPADVKDAPTLAELHSQILPAIKGAEVVIYNAPFDSGFLRYELSDAATIYCAMRRFAEVYGEWNPKYQEWRWKRLEFASRHIGFAWSGAAHRAIHDCAATRAVWHWLEQRQKAAA